MLCPVFSHSRHSVALTKQMYGFSLVLLIICLISISSSARDMELRDKKTCTGHRDVLVLKLTFINFVTIDIDLG